METVHTFSKGLNQDLSFSLQQQDTYFDALNFRLTTKNGLSTGVPENVSGNQEVLVSLPETSNQVLITQVSTGPLETLSINGVPVSFTNSSSWETNLVTAINNDSSLQTLGIHAVYKNNRVLLYSLLDNNSLITSNIVVTGNSSNITVDTNYTPAQTGLKIIGWEKIRDEIYIFSTACVDDIGSYGQIWKMTYSKTEFLVTFSLVYNSQLNFTRLHPIPNPGGVVGNYESSSIKKLYFTDNFNRLRVLNTGDPNVNTLDPFQLILQGITNFSIPILQEIIQSGSVLTGAHQFAYKLLNISGGETRYSQLSSIVQANTHNEYTSSYIDYVGVPPIISSGKSFRYQIQDIDTNYQRIQIIHLYYSAPNAAPEIEIIKEDFTPDSGVYSFTYTGTEVGIPIILEEFNAINTIILKCKTLASKNNYLFPGNILESVFDLSYDSRAYRFNSGINNLTLIPQCFVKDSINNLTEVTAPLYALEDTHDAINPNQNAELLGAINDPYIYQADGRTFGGEGLNIKYRFVPDINDFGSTLGKNCEINLDTIDSGIRGASSISVGKDGYSYTFDNFTRVQGQTFKDFHSPFIQSFLKGYTRGEIYRFGIVFFDKQGNQSYAKWIADIKFPAVYMPDTSTQSTSVDQTKKQIIFPVTRIDSSNNVFGENLGILFDVNIPADIVSTISGFSIVRAVRTEEDRTILGQGLFTLGIVSTQDAGAVRLVDDGRSTGALGPYSPGIPNNHISANTDGNFGTLHTPEHLFGQVDFTFNLGDSIELIGKLKSANADVMSSGDNRFVYSDPNNNNCDLVGQDRNIWYIQNYEYSPPISDIINGSQSSFYLADLKLGANKSVPEWHGNYGKITDPVFLNGFTSDIRNVSVSNLIGEGNVRCQGINTLLLRSGNYPNGTNTFEHFTTIGGNTRVTDGIAGTCDMYLVNYKRERFNQYNGNTYSARAGTEYISTNHYQPVQATGNYTFVVFGGDTFINIFDLGHNKKHFDDSLDGLPSPNIAIPDLGTPKKDYFEGTVRQFPVESTVNLAMRETYEVNTCNGSGAVPNKNDFNDWGRGLDLIDNFYYRSIYSIENTTKVYFPKPISTELDGTYDTRVRFSQEKVNNESTDSWTIFRPADYKDLDTIQGPLTNLIIHQDRLVAFQERGISVLSVNERSLIQDNSGAELVLGNGSILQRYDYISKVIGSRHQFGFTQSQDSVFFFDINTKNLYKLTGNTPVSLSVSKGLTSFFGNNLNSNIQITDNPYIGLGITGTYDFKYNEAVFTFKQEEEHKPNLSFTVCYNDFINAFTSFYSCTPSVYINDGNNIFSPSGSLDDLWIHDRGPKGSFYGNVYPSTIKLLLNDNPIERKVFDTFQWHSVSTDTDLNEIPQDTFNSVRIYNSHQNSDFQEYFGSTKLIGRKLEDLFNLSSLRNRVIYSTPNVNPLDPVNISSTDIPFGERIRSNYVFLDLVYNNDNNYRLVLDTFKINFRISAR